MNNALPHPGAPAPPARVYSRVLPAVCWLVAIWMLFFRLGGFPLMEPDEGRNAEVSREMLESGSWLVPTLNGIPYLDKPAFFFRVVAISMSVFGQNEAGARLPVALSGLGILAMLFAFCRRKYGEPCASLALLAAATAPFFFSFSRLVIMDTMLGLFICACIFSAFLAEEADGRTRRWWYLASAAAAGCGTLVKGPVGFLIPALVVSIFSLLDGRRGAIRRCFAPLHLVVFFAVVLPWFVALAVRHPAFISYGLVQESFHRFVSGGEFRHDEPFYYYLPVVIGGLFPWSLLFPEALVFAWKRRVRWTSADRLFLVWTVVTIIFFSCSRTKQPAYVLSAFVALAALVGRLVGHVVNHRDSPARGLVMRTVLIWAAICAGLFGAGVVVWSGAVSGGQGPLATAIAFVRDAVPSPAALTVLVAVVSLASFAAYWKRSALAAGAAFALLSFGLLTVAYRPLERYAMMRSGRPLALKQAEFPPGTEIIAYHCFPAGLAFYQRKWLPLLDVDRTPEQMRSNYILALWRRGALQSEMVVDVRRLDEWVATRRGPVLVIANETGRYWLGADLAKDRKLPVQDICPGWWGFLIPARGAD